MNLWWSEMKTSFLLNPEALALGQPEGLWSWAPKSNKNLSSGAKGPGAANLDMDA